MSLSLSRIIFPALLLFSLSTQAADFRYVTDQLRLSLYQSADAKSKVLRLLSSGDKLDVKEEAGPYARVVTTEGEEGWVKRGFLQSDPTAINQVEGLEAEMQKMQAELERTADSRAVIEAEQLKNTELLQQQQDLQLQIEQQATAQQAWQQQIDEAKAERDQAIERMEDLKSKPDPIISLKAYGGKLMLLGLVVLIVGVLIGKLMAESRIRRRFHGVKVW